MDENKKVRTDIFEYNKAFSAFKSSTPQNVLGPLYMQALLNQLKDAGYICYGHDPVIIADVCCGAAETTINYLRNVDFQPGFDIRGVDANPEYTGYQGTELITCNMYQPLQSQTGGLAEINLAKAKQSQIIPLKHYRIRHGDVLKDDLVQLLLTKDEMNQKTAPFRLILLSHCVYYFIDDGQENHQQLKDVIDKLDSDLLAQDGIIILLHSILLPNSICAMEAKFSFNRLKDFTPTAEEYSQFSCDAAIRSACQQLGLKCFEISYFSPLYFSQYLSQYADVFKDPSRYDELLSNNEALQDLYCILFMAHRSPQNLYQDTSSTGLTNLVDQTVKLTRSDGHLNGRIAIQIIPSKNASQQFIQRLEAIVDDINNNSQLAK